MEDATFHLSLQEPFNEKQFSVTLGPITWLVGPNGSGKTRFADTLISALGGYTSCRILRADRLAGLELQKSGYFSSGHFNQGFQKNVFSGLKDQAAQFGYGADAIVLLEEDRALRAIVEATLSQIFERRVLFEWDSGILQPRVLPRGKSSAYSLHQDECHGLKELVVHLTHLHDRSKKVLIIDEPELNLHPQYQTYMLEQLRDAAKTFQKRIVLITHSPYMMSLRNVEDLKYVYCFNGDGSLPKIFSDLGDILPSIARRCIAQMNAHHRQIFFAPYVVLVEGVYDRLIIGGLLDRLLRSMAAAGGTIVDVNGKEDIPFYYRLCESLGKGVHVLADLDALLDGSVRKVLGKDDALSTALATAGGGSDISAYIGIIQKELHEIHDELLRATVGHTPLSETAKECLKESRSNDPKAERYMAKLVLTEDVTAFPNFLAAKVQSSAGRLRTVIKAFQQGLGVYFLTKGELEDYISENYSTKFEYSSNSKQELAANTLKLLHEGIEDPLTKIPGLKDLLSIVDNFPQRIPVDYWIPLTELGQEIVQLIQRFASSGELSSLEDARRIMREKFRNVANVVECSEFECKPRKDESEPRRFVGKLIFSFQEKTRTISFDQDTPVYKVVPASTS